jgi:hypothetical protein
MVVMTVEPADAQHSEADSIPVDRRVHAGRICTEENVNTSFR